jgi:hypothetical protein
MSRIMDKPEDLIHSLEAQRLLGVSHTKMAQLLKEGMIPYYLNPLDKRVKLVSRAEVLALKEPKRAEAA